MFAKESVTTDCQVCQTESLVKCTMRFLPTRQNITSHFILNNPATKAAILSTEQRWGPFAHETPSNRWPLKVTHWTEQMSALWGFVSEKSAPKRKAHESTENLVSHCCQFLGLCKHEYSLQERSAWKKDTVGCLELFPPCHSPYQPLKIGLR